jgi:hypothetical protein
VGPQLVGRHKDWIYQKDPDVDEFRVLESETTTGFLSESNANSKVRGVYRDGGPFLLTKRKSVITPSQDVTIYRHGFNASPVYVGRLTAFGDAPPEPIILHDPSIWGPEAISRVKPGKPVFPLSNALYELREVPALVADIPNVFRKGYRQRLHDYGNVYLGTSFGWVPFIRDLASFANDHHRAIKAYKALITNTQRSIRRRIHLHDLTSSWESETDWRPGYGFDQVFVSQCYAGEPEIKDYTGVAEDIWFSGKFSYSVDRDDPLSESLWKNSTLRRLHGLNLTAEALYKAIPWSWLTDWFGNFSANLSNLGSDAVDWSLDYGFMMRQVSSISIRSSRCLMYTWANGETGLVESSAHSQWTLKSRNYASPLGLRLKTENLSGFQMGILGALATKYIRRS